MRLTPDKRLASPYGDLPADIAAADIVVAAAPAVGDAEREGYLTDNLAEVKAVADQHTAAMAKYATLLASYGGFGIPHNDPDVWLIQDMMTDTADCAAAYAAWTAELA